MIARFYWELECWQLANELKKRVYAFTTKRPARLDRKYCDQIRDSARGGPRAIAEGFGRFRSTEFARYLEFARASLTETQNHLGDALDLEYFSESEHSELFKLADRAIGATTNLFKYLKTCGPQPKTKRNQNRELRSPKPNAREPRTHEFQVQELRTQNRRTQNPSTQNPRTQNPRTQNPSTKNPSTQNPKPRTPN